MSEVHRGKLISVEHRKAISETHRGKVVSAATRKKLSEAIFGKRHSAVSIQKMRAAHLGKKHSSASKRKMSAAHRGKVKSREHQARLDRSQAKFYRRNPTLSESLTKEILQELHIRYRFQVPLVGVIVDFYLYEYKVALEVDDCVGTDRNVLRTKRLKDAGYKLLRVSNHMVKHHSDQVALEIARVVCRAKFYH